MKSRIALFFLLFTLTMAATYAQNIKIGYVRVEQLLAEWPATAQANSDLKAYEVARQDQLVQKRQILLAKSTEYQRKATSMSIAQLQKTEKDIQSMQKEIEAYEKNNQTLIDQKNEDLLAPLRNTLKKAVEKIAKGNGFTHVFTSNDLIFTADKTADLSAKVAQELGFNLSKKN